MWQPLFQCWSTGPFQPSNNNCTTQKQEPLKRQNMLETRTNKQLAIWHKLKLSTSKRVCRHFLAMSVKTAKKRRKKDREKEWKRGEEGEKIESWKRTRYTQRKYRFTLDTLRCDINLNEKRMQRYLCVSFRWVLAWRWRCRLRKHRSGSCNRFLPVPAAHRSTGRRWWALFHQHKNIIQKHSISILNQTKSNWEENG